MTTLPETPAKSPPAPVEKPAPRKPAPRKIDAFHPAMPEIPGVHRPSPPPRGADNQRLIQIGGIVAAVLLVGLAVLWWIKSIPRGSVASPIPADATVDSAVPPPPFAVSAPSVTHGPTVAATVEELSKPWASKKFTFVNPVTSEGVDAIVIKLPSGAFWAFSLQEPYGQCQLEFVTDLARLASQFRYHASHPMVVSSCSNTIYDPLKVGPLGGDVWAEGRCCKAQGLQSLPQELTLESLAIPSLPTTSSSLVEVQNAIKPQRMI